MGWIGVDLDGTLATYTSGEFPLIGEPVEPMVRRVKDWLAQGKDVRIFTARACDPRPEIVPEVERWCEEHIGQVLPVTNVKDYEMIELWDDRAIQVIVNKGMPILGSPLARHR